jgi:hypothetical protein
MHCPIEAMRQGLTTHPAKSSHNSIEYVTR